MGIDAHIGWIAWCVGWWVNGDIMLYYSMGKQARQVWRSESKAGLLSLSQNGYSSLEENLLPHRINLSDSQIEPCKIYDI